MLDIRPLAELTDAREFLAYLEHVGAELPFDADVAHGPSSPLAGPVSFSGLTAGNRFCVHPLEGWDADVEGRPTSSTRERWRRMGQGGAKLIWAESAAVRPDGRSTPSQLLVADETVSDLAALRQLAVEEHERVHGDVSDLVVGLQLTHSGRMSHPAPHGVPAPVAVRRHPHMDATVGPPPDQPLLTDDELYALADDFVRAAVNAALAGFDFVDLKACHGYLHHELLGAYERPGEFGGPLENRTRFLRTVIDGVRAIRPDLPLALRLSAFDTVTYVPDAAGFGRPITDGPDRFWFGTDDSGHKIDLAEPIELLRMLRDLDVGLVSVTGSSPYSARHFQRPARRLTGNDYEPPEDPLVGVARHVHVTGALKAAVPELVYVGSAYSYLQQWLPNVAQAAVRKGLTDVVGIGRMHLAYNMFPTDVIAGRRLRIDLIQPAF
ncbi:MAG TPA: NADH:flavin oxidoreductase [Ilumatobacteraceae bacterium]|nr:NADH:flavin oxidoreductase [Ilumatobacteraceae bacterium]